MKKQRIPAGDFFYVPYSAEQQKEDIRQMLRQPGGRRFFRTVLRVADVLGVTYGADGRITEYNEGRRGVGLWLATKIDEAEPGAVAKLMQESTADRLAGSRKAGKEEDDE